MPKSPRKSPPTKKPVRARRMWLNDDANEVHTILNSKTCIFAPVLVLPGDNEAIERMIAQGTVALEQADSCDHREDVCIVLRSLGIHPLK